MKRPFAFDPRTLRSAGLILAVGLVSGCDEIPSLGFLQPADKAETETTATAEDPGALQRDVEAPEVFEIREAGLWDGRPSLGGVWVAHPDVTDPERVIIRNATNGKSVVGALFRRERDIPGPRLQASSDAAAELDMLAGAPVELHVVALRRETVEPATSKADVAPLEDSGEIEATTLDPVAGAAAAIEASEAPTTETLAAAEPASDTTKPVSSSLQRPYIQIGIFSVEANAARTAQQMQATGLQTDIRAQELDGKPYWRVLVGPAGTGAERSALLDQVKAQGFSDAYSVRN